MVKELLVGHAPGVSLFFAALAAIFWAWSAIVNIPIIGSGFGTLTNMPEFYAALRKIAGLNAQAAACAAASALFQALAMYNPMH